MTQLLCYLLSLVVAQANLTDGQSVSGELKSLSDRQVVMVVDNQDRALAVDVVHDVTFAGQANEPPVGPLVTLADESVCRAAKLRVAKGGKAQIEGPGGESASCDVGLIASVQYFSGGDAAFVKQWTEILDNRGSDDFLVVNKKGNLDYLAGVIGEVDDEQLVFVYGGSRLDIPMSRVAGLVFAKRPPKEFSPRAVVTTRNGSTWHVSDLAATPDALQLTSAGGASVAIPSTTIRAIEFLRAGVVYLTDQEPESTSYRPYFLSKVSGQRLQTLATPKHDVSFAGTPIQIMDKDGQLRDFDKGLAVQSRTELSYRLAKKFQRFQATIGLDPAASVHGDVLLRLFADDQQIFEQSISKDSKALELDVSVADANRLRILVDFGKNLDIGDRLHFGGAKLIQ